MASANKAVLAEINTWIEVMTFPETEPLQIPDPATVVATALEHFSADFTSSPTAVGEALDNIACRGWGEGGIAAWNAEKSWNIGKQGYRGDAIGLLLGLGIGIGKGQSGPELIASGVDEYEAHCEREGADSGDRRWNEKWAKETIDYLSAPASARAALARTDLLTVDD
ncbi:hypothetical protein PXH69_21515 [Rhodococcus qingshengii]|uniref:Uncharacterized protein n=1 Tax=Rhodococcus qingshengii TaxID=334542 RepID=A0AAW6LQM0_RHOSG|nr:hypothetical protein [Rhodococcus qingshengii]MDE8647556.1 hypothetical protein [Rhodococcus qingshengii]